MPEEVLLDSNIAVKHLRRKTSVVTAKMAETDQLYLSETVLGELYYVAYHGEHTESELAKIDELLRAVAILYHDGKTAKLYGQVAAKLAKAGTPIPQNDMWIAAIAFQCDLPLATTDKHFGYVKGLTVLDWSE